MGFRYIYVFIGYWEKDVKGIFWERILEVGIDVVDLGIIGNIKINEVIIRWVYLKNRGEIMER